MKNNEKAIWFHVESLLFDSKSKDDSSKYPSFFNPADYLWSDLVAANYALIRDEFEKYKYKKSIKPYFYKEQANNTLKWKTLPLLTWNIKRKSAKLFPQTSKILASIPGLVSASFSLLEAGGEISTHRGDTDATIRGHLCLYTSKDTGKAKLTVNNESREWEEGKWLLFCDAHLHGAYNHSSQDRLVLIVDIVHPEFIGFKNKICSKVLAGLLMNFILVNIKIVDISKFNRLFLYCMYSSFNYLLRIIIFFKIRI